MPATLPDIDALAALEGPLGVLSVYVDADPSRPPGNRPQWEIVLRNSLKELRERVKAEEPHERWAGIHAALDGLEPELAAIAELGGEGRGRALFAALGEGPPEIVRLQLPLPDRVELRERAYLAPLLAALDEGRPTGVVNVARDGIRVLDLRGGTAEDLDMLEFDEDTSQWRERVGTSGHNPALGTPAGGGGTPGGGPSTGSMYQQSGSPQRDRYDRKLEDHQIRFVANAADELTTMARRHGWRRMVIVGDPRLTEPLRARLPGPDGIEALFLEGTYEWRRPAELAEALAPELDRAQRAREQQLVAEARDRAAARGHGAVGLPDVLDALQQGRVDTLLIVAGRSFAGVRAPDGRLAAHGAIPVGASPDEVVPEPALEERLVELALGTSASVVPVEDAAADALDECGGVAALLRW